MRPLPRKTSLLVALVTIPAGILAAMLAPRPEWMGAGDTIWPIFLGQLRDYAIWAGAFFVLFWLVLHPLLKRRQLSRRRWPKPSQALREVLFSLSSQAIFLAVAFWLSFTNPWGIQNNYTDFAEYGWLWAAFVTFAVLVVDDTWFYWSHRAMHHPWLFDRIHRVHHESVDPTPFTAYSFHPLEAVMHGVGSLSLLVVVLILPHHVSSLIVASILQVSFNVIGHLGYEIYPRWWHRLPLLKWKTPTMHHYMHHQRVGGNYGLYFRWWDRLCGTEFKDYETRYDRLFAETDKSRPVLPETLAP